MEFYHFVACMALAALCGGLLNGEIKHWRFKRQCQRILSQ